MNVIRLDELKVKVERTEGGRKQRRLGGSGELKMLNTASLTAGWGLPVRTRREARTTSL